MLSPHEFATLLLVKDAPNQIDMEREELDALLEDAHMVAGSDTALAHWVGVRRSLRWQAWRVVAQLKHKARAALAGRNLENNR